MHGLLLTFRAYFSVRELGLWTSSAPEGAANIDEKSKDGNRSSFDKPLLSCRAGCDVSVAFVLLPDTVDGVVLHRGR